MALLSHLGTLAGYLVGFGHVLVPLLVYLVWKDRSQFVREHALESLNFQISMTIYYVVSIALAFVLIGIPMLIALAILDLVCVIRATLRARDGESYRYPMTFRLVH